MRERYRMFIQKDRDNSPRAKGCSGKAKGRDINVTRVYKRKLNFFISVSLSARDEDRVNKDQQREAAIK